jgi:phosphoglycolate phosphatase
MNYRLAIFDLDGTLLDTSPGIFATANKTIERLGLEPVHDKHQLSKFIGPPITECFGVVYGLPASRTSEAVSLYRQQYDITGRYEASEYQGISEGLKQLNERGYLLAVGTLKGETLAQEMLTHFNLAPYFETIRGTLDEAARTKAEIVTLILEELGVTPDEAVLIGDTPHDLEGARLSGVSFIAVDWGFGYPRGVDLLDGMDRVVRSVEELLSVL